MQSEVMGAIKQMMKAASEHGSLDYPEDGNFTELRQVIDKMSANQQVDPGVTFVKDYRNGVEVELSMPNQLTGETIILYIHGGAFITGNAKASRAYASQLAAESGLRVYSITYRLAPENPYPDGLNDCFEVYQSILETHPKSDVVMIGDSAGGTLALVTTLLARDKEIQLPAAVCAFSPVTEISETLPSRLRNRESDFCVKSEINEILYIYYCHDHNPRDHYISPLYGDYTGFPPLMIVADSGEVLIDDTTLLAGKAKAANVTVELQIWDDTFHAFPTLGRSTPESTQVLMDTVHFIKKTINRNVEKF